MYIINLHFFYFRVVSNGSKSESMARFAGLDPSCDRWHWCCQAGPVVA